MFQLDLCLVLGVLTIHNEGPRYGRVRVQTIVIGWLRIIGTLEELADLVFEVFGIIRIGSNKAQHISVG